MALWAAPTCRCGHHASWKPGLAIWYLDVSQRCIKLHCALCVPNVLQGDHFKEAVHINKSLTTLGRVIMELVEAQRTGRKGRHIPYRDSRLTFLLQVGVVLTGLGGGVARHGKKGVGVGVQGLVQWESLELGKSKELPMPPWAPYNPSPLPPSQVSCMPRPHFQLLKRKRIPCTPPGLAGWQRQDDDHRERVALHAVRRRDEQHAAVCAASQVHPQQGHHQPGLPRGRQAAAGEGSDGAIKVCLGCLVGGGPKVGPVERAWGGSVGLTGSGWPCCGHDD